MQYSTTSRPRDAGLPDFEILSWTMLPVPAPSPAAVVEWPTVNASLRDSAVLARLTEAGLDVRGGSAADAAAFLRAEIAKGRPIARRSGGVLD